MLKIQPGSNQTLAGLDKNKSVPKERGPRVETGREAAASSGGVTVNTSSRQGRIEFSRLERINDRMNGTATAIRNDDRKMEQLNKRLAEMKAALFEFRKIYPPYPVGDSKRVEFLRSIDGLRKEIDRLTIPPPAKWEGELSGDSLAQYEAAPTAADDTATAPASMWTAMRTEEVPVQDTDFSIPPLPDTASDADMQQTMDQIDKAMATIAERREQLADQAAVIGQIHGQDAKAEVMVQSPEETWDFAVPGEAEAEQKSGEVRREIALIPTDSMLGGQTHIADLQG